MREQSSSQLGLLTQKNAFPNVFRWKVATIIIMVLIAIFFIVDLIMLIHLLRNQPRKQNHTFAADVFSLLPQDASVYAALNPLNALIRSYSQMRYQKTSKVVEWTNGQPALTLQTIADVFLKEDKQLLTFMQISDGQGRSFSLSAYTNIGFTLPEDDWESYLGQKDNYYFTFQIKDRQSVLLGTENYGYLKMDGSTESLFDCQMLRLSSSNLTYLNAATIGYSAFDSATQFSFPSISATQSKCFQGQPTPSSFSASLSSMTGIQNLSASFNLTLWLVYHLSQ